MRRPGSAATSPPSSPAHRPPLPAALLDSVADRETSGTASVWRFSCGSIRRALDAGRGPEGMTADLTAVTAGPLPQPLSYLISDAGPSASSLSPAFTASCPE
ncbi:helicase-associated domain-containing protein [Streptomyces sp. NPDC001415]